MEQFLPKKFSQQTNLMLSLIVPLLWSPVLVIVSDELGFKLIGT